MHLHAGAAWIAEYDLDTFALLQAAAALNSGHDLAGNEVKGRTSFCIGAVVNPGPLGGTIMSYCHLLSGGYGNVDLRFHDRCITERMLPEIDSVTCLGNYSGGGSAPATYFYTVAPCRAVDTRNAPGPFAAADLATIAGRALLARQSFAADELDEVILGCASPSPDEVNIGRVVALRMGCGQSVPGWTVMRNCASGMQALDSAVTNIQAGRSSLVLAGGADALSRAPLLFSDAMVRWLSGWYAAKTFGQRAAAIRRFKLGYLAPVIGIVKGLTDPVVGLMMGQTAENLAWRFGISREEMDAFAVRSHQRVAAAQDAQRPAAGGAVRGVIRLPSCARSRWPSRRPVAARSR